MTRVVYVHATTRNVVATVDVEEAVPVAGDLLALPDHTLYRVIQRVIIIDKYQGATLIDISKGQPLTLSIQCAVVPVDIVEEEPDKRVH